jgi:hypothetical protein
MDSTMNKLVRPTVRVGWVDCEVTNYFLKLNLMMYIFSEISNTGKLPENTYSSIEDYKQMVLADALNDWGSCMAGGTLPENFGTGMAEVSVLLGTASPDGLMELARQL